MACDWGVGWGREVGESENGRMNDKNLNVLVCIEYRMYSVVFVFVFVCLCERVCVRLFVL